MKIAQFIEEHGISITAIPADENPHLTDARPEASHWRCILKKEGNRKTFRTFFTMGAAHLTPPTADDVLDCIASDSSSVENNPKFEDWAGEFGYDTDSRSAEKTYKICRKQAKALKEWLGNEAYETLLWKVERQ